MSVVVVATAKPLAEHRAAVIAAFEETIGRVHEEPGCELYALHEGEDRLVMIEKWADGDALAVHGRGPALKELGGKLKGLLGEPLEVLVLRPHPAGDPDRGAL